METKDSFNCGDVNAELTDAGSGAHPAWDGGADAFMPVPVTISFARQHRAQTASNLHAVVSYGGSMADPGPAAEASTYPFLEGWRSDEQEGNMPSSVRLDLISGASRV